MHTRTRWYSVRTMPGWAVLGSAVLGLAGRSVAQSSHPLARPAWFDGVTWCYIDIDPVAGMAESRKSAPAERGADRLGEDPFGLQSRLDELADMGVGGVIVRGMLSADLREVRRRPFSQEPSPGSAETTVSNRRRFSDVLRAAHARGLRVVLDPGSEAAAAWNSHAIRWLDLEVDEGASGRPSSGIDGWLVPFGPRTNAARTRATAKRLRTLHPEAVLLGRADVNGGDTKGGARAGSLGTDIIDGLLDARFSEASASFVAGAGAESTAAFMSLLRSTGDADRPRTMPCLGASGTIGQNGSFALAALPSDDVGKDRLRLALCALMLGAENPVIGLGAERVWTLPNASNGSDATAQRFLFGRELRRLIQLLIGLRSAHQPLRTGAFRSVRSDAARTLIIFARRTGDEEAIAVINHGAKKRQVTVSAHWPGQLAVILSPQLRAGRQGGGPFVVGGSRQQADSWGDVRFWVDSRAVRLVLLGADVQPHPR